jgi:hypothetical protein
VIIGASYNMAAAVYDVPSLTFIIDFGYRDADLFLLSINNIILTISMTCHKWFCRLDCEKAKEPTNRTELTLIHDGIKYSILQRSSSGLQSQ